ncbi:RagB/SusD family nutrient uptake outer membrane protein [Bacteroides sp. 224]|uniref:RagB/SusD family nutrient uptake outer membrane protein n=1 Tax=Bacteroides sp. 224 TaxID=2302936 RepID=UPI0013D66495|nr:RagB/SusD family nutrient uptake outer membrane protein [Bacteroides sp. 224]NDV65427.1 RagB/SusD family nutrient uptake outer membrane protein [Bacteroides sp. 224]
MKKIRYITLALATALTINSCDFLDETPQGILSEEEAKAPSSIEGLVTAAYSSLGNDHYDKPFSLWPYGTIRSDDAYKGGGDENDIVNFHFYEISENIKTDFGEADGLWFQVFQAISRANSALSVLKQTEEKSFELKNTRMGEMYFLRGYFYFMLKQVFGNVPFVNEDTPIADYEKTPNNLPNDKQWALICDDFKKAYDLLPAIQSQVGRVNKIAAAAHLAKAYLYKAYRQDNANSNVLTSINAADLEEVVKYTQVVLNSSYDLEQDMACNFLPGAYENGKESIFAIQFSVDDGTMFGRLNFSDVLSLPMGLGCCDFHKPSQNLVNAFKTKNGLPDFESYDTDNYRIGEDAVDPRLYHTVALPGIPYKYNEELIYEENWNRNINTYGIYASLKENVDPSCDCFKNLSPFYGNSKNRIVIRYADVILMQAEALIELNRQNEALSLINQIRERAKNSTLFIPYAKNLQVSLYQDGVNCTWTQDFAREALRWERRLEMAMEGSRFFDLVRWGIVTDVMNDFFTTESKRRVYLANGKFDKNKDEYIPIPQQQIGFTNGLYEQNPGW